jgi:hypothetical protein
MNLKRTTTIAVVGAALAAWLAGAATSNHVIPSVPVHRPEIVEQRGAALAGEIERLHERLAPSTAPSTPGRNLFTFHAAAVRPVAPIVTAPAPHAALTEFPAPLAQPALKLSGIAEDAGPDGPIRIAFISGEGQLFMVKEGETLTPRYRVAKISPDVVELTDVIDNSTRRLALR